MKPEERIYDKVRMVYEMDLAFDMGLEAVMGWVKVMEEQMKKTLPPGQKIIEITPVLKSGLLEIKNETN